MYTGKIWLDFENEDESACYAAEVTRGIIRNDELILEFSGHDDGGYKFVASCRLYNKYKGARYSGEGRFKYNGNNETTSDVEITFERDGSEIFLHGTWTDEGEKKGEGSYTLEAELKQSE